MPGNTFTIDINSIVKNSTFDKRQEDVYSNQTQIYVGYTDVIVDYFFLSPKPGNGDQWESHHVQRVVLSHSAAKGLLAGLKEAIDRYENNITQINK